MDIDVVIKHYLHILSKEYERGMNAFVLENLFKTNKFKTMLAKKPHKLFLIYAGDFDWKLTNHALLVSGFFNDDGFIYAEHDCGGGIGEFMYATILCNSQENLNLFKLTFNLKYVEITDLSTILEKIYELGDNNV
jgi:hypothetical protein